MLHGILQVSLVWAQVATQRDPASARLGESLYTFMPRSVVGNLRDGVVMELERLRARKLPFLSLHNRRDTPCPVQLVARACPTSFAKQPCCLVFEFIKAAQHSWQPGYNTASCLLLAKCALLPVAEEWHSLAMASTCRCTGTAYTYMLGRKALPGMQR